MISAEEIKKALQEMDIASGYKEENRMMVFLDLITAWNLKTSITGTKEREEILKRHFFDCLSPYSFFHSLAIEKRRPSLLDIGTGGGLPGILLAIFFEEFRVSLLDSKRKNTLFLEEVIKTLDLQNATVISGRAEELAHENRYRENFDFVTARAIAVTSVIAELSLPFCKPGGRVMLYKSRKVFEEVKDATDIINKLGGQIEEIKEIRPPYLDEYRALLVIRKVSPSLYKYPRKYAKIIKTSLIDQKGL
jgi:16S rRNA (guanine527-N7)-methyltransferase